LKKIVVVVGKEEIVFTGKELTADNVHNNLLVIKEEDKVVGVFLNWTYWKATSMEDKTIKKKEKPNCFGMESCGTEQYDRCICSDECSFISQLVKNIVDTFEGNGLLPLDMTKSDSINLSNAKYELIKLFKNKDKLST